MREPVTPGTGTPHASTLLGTCGGLLSERCGPEPEIGYEVAAAMRGNGLAREAAQAVTAATHDFGVSRLWATVRAHNAASLHVLASLGYVLEHTEQDDLGALVYLFSDIDENPQAQ